MAPEHTGFIAVLIALFKMICGATGQCTTTEYSIKQMMLRQHTFKSLKTSNSFECLLACEDDVICQSFNYVTPQNKCELNNRTREASPADFVPNFIRYYYGRVNNRGEHFIDPGAFKFLVVIKSTTYQPISLLELGVVIIK